MPVGAMAMLALIVFPTLGLLLIAVAVAVTRKAPHVLLGLLTGAGLPLLYVAYLNRAGPGAVCYHTALSGGCDQHLNPVPWLLIGLCLIAGGVLGQARRP